MKLSKEHILALKISILLLVFAIIISYFISFYNHNFYINYKSWMWWKNMNSFANIKYYIFILLSIFIYFISYFLAKFTIKPIEENNKKLKEYNHNLAHEIKTPLSVIKSNLELLKIWYDKEIIDSSMEELDIITNITNSLLFLSQKNNNIDKKPININSFFKDLNKNDFVINNKWQFDIKWNNILISRMVDNIIDNALKYRSKKTKIIIDIYENIINISNKIDKDIDNSYINKLFDTFYQMDNSRNTSWYYPLSNHHHISLW